MVIEYIGTSQREREYFYAAMAKHTHEPRSTAF